MTCIARAARAACLALAACAACESESDLMIAADPTQEVVTGVQECDGLIAAYASCLEVRPELARREGELFEHRKGLLAAQAADPSLRDAVARRCEGLFGPRLQIDCR